MWRSRFPAHVYELFPLAVLIGTLVRALTPRGQFRIHRHANVGPRAVARVSTLFRIGVVFAVATLIIRELIAPVSERAAKQLKLSATSTIVASEFHTGLWVKDDRDSSTSGRSSRHDLVRHQGVRIR